MAKKKFFGYSPCGTHPWWHLSQYRMCLFPGVNESHEHPFTVHLIDVHIVGVCPWILLLSRNSGTLDASDCK